METVLIKEEFEYLEEDMKHLFLKYLHKNLQDSVNGELRTRGYYVDEEHFVSIEEMSLSLSEGFDFSVEFKTNWIKGNLLDLGVSADLNATDWSALVIFLNKIITKSFAMLMAQKKEKYFFRSRFAYIGLPLDGAYFVKNFRISPATQGNGNYRGENYIYLDMNIEGIDETHASSKSRAFGKEVTAILSVILNTGFYSVEYEKRWVLLSDKEHGCFQLGFYGENPTPKSMPKKDPQKSGSFLEDNDNTDQNTLCLPRTIRKLFNAYYSLSADEQAAFLSASRMYQISLTAKSKTVSAAYQIAALDALSKLYRESNFNKNAVMKLVDKYYEEGKGKKIGNLYDSIRNAHFHQGHFEEDELSGIEIRPFLGPNWIFQEVDYLFHTKAVCLILNNWLSEKISTDVQ